MECPICKRKLDNTGTKYFIQTGQNEPKEVCPVCYVRIELRMRGERKDND